MIELTLLEPLVSATGGNFGIGLVNTYITDVLGALNERASEMGGTVMGYARGLGIIFSMILAATQAYKVVLQQQGQLDILVIGKPLLFALLLANWTLFADAIYAPGRAIESVWASEFSSRVSEVDYLRTQRGIARRQLANTLMFKSAAADIKEEAGESAYDRDVDQTTENNWVSSAYNSVKKFVGNAWDGVSSFFSGKLVDKVYGFGMKVSNIFISLLLELITWIGEFLWQIGMYSMFLIQALYKTILYAFGPVYVICALVPAWGSALTDWIGKLVKTSLIGTMTYMAMTFSLFIIKQGLEAELSIINYMNANQILNISDSLSATMSTLTLSLVGYVVGYVVIKRVPEMVNLAFPGSGFGQAASAMGAGMAGAAAGAAMAVPKAAAGAVK